MSWLSITFLLMILISFQLLRMEAKDKYNECKFIKNKKYYSSSQDFINSKEKLENCKKLRILENN